MNNTFSGLNTSLEFYVPHHVKNFLLFLIPLNSACSLFAIVFNFLIILTFVKTPTLRSPSFILILSLAISDFGVGIVIQPMYCAYLIAWLKNDNSLFEKSIAIYNPTYRALITGSVLTVTCITIDRFLAVHLYLRYQEIVTKKRIYIAMVIIWVFSLSWGFILETDQTWLFLLYMSMGVITVFLNLVLMLNISRTICKHSAQIHVQPQQAIATMNIQRYKKSVKTMYYIMGVFLVCFPLSVVYFFVHYVLKLIGTEISIGSVYIEQIAASINMLSSLLNPIIYCWRIEEIRSALLQLLKRQ